MLLWERDLAASKEGSIQNQCPLHSTRLCLTLILTRPRLTSLTTPKHITLHGTPSLLIGGRPLHETVARSWINRHRHLAALPTRPHLKTTLRETHPPVARLTHPSPQSPPSRATLPPIKEVMPPNLGLRWPRVRPCRPQPGP